MAAWTIERISGLALAARDGGSPSLVPHPIRIRAPAADGLEGAIVVQHRTSKRAPFLPEHDPDIDVGHVVTTTSI
jgi:hypothetical protein